MQHLSTFKEYIMAGDGRGLLNTDAMTQTSTWVGLASTVLGVFPQETLDSMLSGASGKTMFWTGLIISVVKMINFKTLFGK